MSPLVTAAPLRPDCQKTARNFGLMIRDGRKIDMYSYYTLIRNHIWGVQLHHWI